jgi:FKBP-type peptidyl-prolyl cis-trans isomerase
MSLFKKSLLPAALASLSLSLALAGQAQAETAKLDSVEARVSYGIGLNVGSSMKADAMDFDLDAIISGIRDAYTGAELQITEQEIQQAFAEMQAKVQQEALAKRDDQLNFLTENLENEGVVETESGLQYKIISQGEGGKSPSATDIVKVHYTGTLIDGTKFDSSVDRGVPAEFPLNGVISGWTEGLQLMSEGDKFQFYIPYNLAYGEQGSGSIPAFATLVFDVELIEIVTQ